MEVDDQHGDFGLVTDQDMVLAADQDMVLVLDQDMVLVPDPDMDMVLVAGMHDECDAQGQDGAERMDNQGEEVEVVHVAQGRGQGGGDDDQAAGEHVQEVGAVKDKNQTKSNVLKFKDMENKPETSSTPPGAKEEARGCLVDEQPEGPGGDAGVAGAVVNGMKLCRQVDVKLYFVNDNCTKLCKGIQERKLCVPKKAYSVMTKVGMIEKKLQGKVNTNTNPSRPALKGKRRAKDVHKTVQQKITLYEGFNFNFTKGNLEKVTGGAATVKKRKINISGVENTPEKKFKLN